jgi:hypothetical protein
MKRKLAVPIWSFGILGLVMLLPLSAAFAQLPDVTTGTCSVPRMSYVTSSATATTPISPTFVDLRDMFVGFEIAEDQSAEGQCVKIEFSFVLSAPSPGGIEINALFDASPGLTVPDGIQMPPGLSVGYHSFTFIVPVETGLGPGGHQVEIQVRGNGGGTLATRKRSLVVHHN